MDKTPAAAHASHTKILLIRWWPLPPLSGLLSPREGMHQQLLRPCLHPPLLLQIIFRRHYHLLHLKTLWAKKDHIIAMLRPPPHNLCMDNGMVAISWVFLSATLATPQFLKIAASMISDGFHPKQMQKHHHHLQQPMMMKQPTTTHLVDHPNTIRG